MAGGGIVLASGSGNMIEHNLIRDFYAAYPLAVAAGIMLDKANRQLRISGNLIHNITSYNREGVPLVLTGSDILVDNNIFANNDNMIDILYKNLEEGFSSSFLTISGNIFQTRGGFFAHYFSCKTLPPFLDISKNIYYHPGGDYYIHFGGDAIPCSEWQGRG